MITCYRIFDIQYVKDFKASIDCFKRRYHVVQDFVYWYKKRWYFSQGRSYDNYIWLKCQIYLIHRINSFLSNVAYVSSSLKSWLHLIKVYIHYFLELNKTLNHTLTCTTRLSSDSIIEGFQWPFFVLTSPFGGII